MGDEAYQRESGESPISNYAAKLCDDYKAGGYDDWFLPSLDELDVIFKASDNAAGLLIGENDEYWSSSEMDGTAVFAIYFGVKIFEGGFRSRRPGAAQGWMR